MRATPAITGLALILLAAACTSPGVRHNDDGTLSVECAGGYHDWSQCYQRAADACRPGAMEIVSRVSNEGSSGVGSRDWSTAGSVVSRTLVVRCTP
jgi:hypothetical protein